MKSKLFKKYPTVKKKALPVLFFVVCSAALLGWFAYAHSVGQVNTTVFLGPETVDYLVDRVNGGGSPGLIVGDIFDVIVQFSPVPNGSTVGAGGYATIYVPPGTEVVGADVIKPNLLGGYDSVAPPLPGPVADGWGLRGRKVWDAGTPWNPSTYNSLCATYGQTAANCDGSNAQHYADTGIFYGTDSRLAVFTSPDVDGIIRPTNGYNINPTGANGLLALLGYSSGHVHNLWDASMANAFGSTDASVTGLAAPKSAESGHGGLNGAGPTPFNAGSAVAGPDSGYKLDYTGTTGPWSRVSYTGSRVGTNTIGPATSINGSAGAAGSATAIVGSATTAGWVLSTSNPLPAGTKAIRYAIGKLTAGDISFVRAKFRVTTTPPTTGININAEVFGGDSAEAAGFNNKDTVWRYHIPSITRDNTNLYVLKKVVKVNGANYLGGPIPANAKLRYRTTYVNTGPTTQVNVVLTDTLPTQTAAGCVSAIALITGVNILPISPAAPACAGSTFTYQTIASLAPGASGSVEYDVQTNAVLNDIVTNTVRATSTQQTVALISNAVSVVQNRAVLTPLKTVTPGSAQPGDEVTYTLTITNTGTLATSATQPLIVKDVLPTSGGSGSTPRFNFVTGSSTFVGIGSVTPTVTSPPTVLPFTADNREEVTWNFGNISIAIGGTFTVIFRATIGSAVPTSPPSYTNNVIVTYNDGASSAESRASNVAPVTVATQNADLSLNKTVSTLAPNEGQAISYTITVTNAGPGSATGVTVSDVLPTGVTYVSSTPSMGSFSSSTSTWTVGTIPNGGSATLTLNVTVNSGTSGTTITNMAQVASSGLPDPDSAPGNSVPSEDDQKSVAFVVNSADLSVNKTVSNSAPVEGASISYTVTVSNAGPQTMASVVVKDLLPAGVTFVSSTPSQGSYVSGTGLWTVGTISSGANATLDLNVTVNAGTSNTTITNTAQVFSAGLVDPDSTPNNNAPAEDDQKSVNITVSGADLSVTKTVDNPTPNVGATIAYTVTVTNDSLTNSAASVVVKDLLPAGVTFVSATPSQGSYVSGTGMWTIGTITAGAIKTLTLTATVNAGTTGQTIVNGVEVFSTSQIDPDSTPNNLSTTEDDDATAPIVVGAADLSVTKTVNNASPNAGGAIAYTVTVLNAGPNAATVVVVKDLLPTGVTFVSSTPSQGSYVSGTGLWTVGTVSNGGSANIVINVTVNAGTTGQTIVNTTQVTASGQADPDSTPNNDNALEDDQASKSIFVGSADLSLDKTVSNSSPSVGQLISYTVTVTNGGPNSATNVSVKDLLPAGVTYVSSTPSQGTYTDVTGIWDIGTIANGTFKTLTINITVNSGTENQTIANLAQVFTSDQLDLDSTPNNNNASEDDQKTVSFTVNTADLSVNKTVSNATPQVGQAITYTVTVSNAGVNTATSVVLKDILPAGLTFVSSTPSQGSYVSGTGMWTVGSVNSGSSATLQISATVNSGTVGNTITNTAEVFSVVQGDPDSTPNNNNASEDDQKSVNIVVAQNSADLSVIKTVDQSNPLVGATIVFTISISNSGPITATNVVLQDLLPTQFTFVSSAPSQGSYVSGTGFWTVGTVNNGASASLLVTATVNAGTSGQSPVNVAEIFSVDQSDSDSTPNNGLEEDDRSTAAVSIAERADLSVTKTVNNTAPNVGGSVTYSLTVLNSGVSTATGVEVLDLLPSGVTFSNATPSQGTYNSGTGVWIIGSIITSANATLQIVASATGTVGQTITNTAQVSAALITDPDSTPNNSVGTEDDQASVALTIAPSGGGGGGGSGTPTPTFTMAIASCSATKTVSVTLTGSNVGSYQLSNTNDFTQAVWISAPSFPATISWTLSAGDGSKTIYARYTNTSGSPFSATPINVTLDELNKCVAPPVPPLTCNLCSRMTYDVYIINPDGSERHTGTPWVKVTEIGNGIRRYAFEDKTIDPANASYDHNDAVVDVDFKDCQSIKFTFVSSEAGWHHAIRFKVSIDGVQQTDTLVSNDDKAVVGTSKQVNANTGISQAKFCAEVPPVLPPKVVVPPPVIPPPVVPPPTTPPVCNVCSHLTYDVYIINPDGTERHTGTPWVRVTDRGNGIKRYAFEDATLDPTNSNFDHNDSVVDVDLKDCASVRFSFVSADAGWKHRIRFKVSIDGVQQSNTLVAADDDVARGTSKIVNAKSNVSTVQACSAPEVTPSVVTTPIQTPVTPAIPTTPSIPVPSLACTIPQNITRNLSRDITGSDVLSLQNLLKCFGYLPATVTPNGTFGPATENAVRLLQTALGIPPNGVVGATTRSALQSYVGAPVVVTPIVTPPVVEPIAPVVVPPVIVPPTSVTPTTPAPPLSCTTPKPFTRNLSRDIPGEDVLALQNLLKCFGYFPPTSTPNGYFGPLTETAVRQLQTALGLPSNGVIGTATRTALQKYVVVPTTTPVIPPVVVPPVLEPVVPPVVEPVVPPVVVPPVVVPTVAITPPSLTCTTPATLTRNLSRDISGNDVLALQNLLQCFGYFPTTVTPNGYFGPLTETAVRQMQTALGLTSNGVVGLTTRTSLKAYVPAPPVLPPVTPEVVPPPEVVTPPVVVAPPVCDVCTKLAYDVYIINPDGAEKHTGTPWVKVTDLGGGSRRYSFEDKTIDPANISFDHNDAVVDVDFKDCESVKFTFVSSDAGWHHAIRFKVSIDGVQQTDTLVADDDKGVVGLSRIINAKDSVNETNACLSTTASTGTTNLTCSTPAPFTRNLSRNIPGNDVLALQDLLKCLGYFPVAIASNGYFGPTTQESVRKFQAAVSLTVNGIVGLTTRTALAPYVAK